MERVYQLWDELGQFPPSETDQALTHLARGLAKLLRADNVRWLGAVRVHRGAAARADGLLGWRLRASYNLVPDPAAYLELIAWWFQRSNKIDSDFQIGLATHAMVAGAGKFRVHRMRDGWIPFAKFRRSEHYKLHYTELGITERTARSHVSKILSKLRLTSRTQAALWAAREGFGTAAEREGDD